LDAAETAVVVAAATGDNRTDAHSTMGEDLLLPPGKGERVEILDEGTRLGEDNTTVLPEGESADSTPAVRTAQMFKELPQRLFAFASDDREEMRCANSSIILWKMRENPTSLGEDSRTRSQIRSGDKRSQGMIFTETPSRARKAAR
jgi:hypothetical protein